MLCQGQRKLSDQEVNNSRFDCEIDKRNGLDNRWPRHCFITWRILPRRADAAKLGKIRLGKNLRKCNMAKFSFSIGKTLTECVNAEDTALVSLPGASRDFIVRTYCRQLYPGVRALVKLGEANAIIKEYPPVLADHKAEAALAEKRAELLGLAEFLSGLSSDCGARARILIGFLAANKLLDRSVYSLKDKLRHDTHLSKKEIVPLIDAVYTALRKKAGANAAKKHSLRDFIETGSGSKEFFDWLTVHVDPIFGLFRRHEQLSKELAAAEANIDESKTRKLLDGLKVELDKIKNSQPPANAVEGFDVNEWLTDVFGGPVGKHFFATITSVHQVTKSLGCVSIQSGKLPECEVNQLGTAIGLCRWSSLVAALDRALSHMVLTYAEGCLEIKRISSGRALHSGLLIRGLLGDPDPIRILYPESLTLARGPDKDLESLVGLIKWAFVDGTLAASCAAYYEIDEAELQRALSAAVSIQQEWLRLLPIEVHLLAAAIESRIRLIEQSKQLGKRDLRHPMIRREIINLNGRLKIQIERCQRIAKQLKRDFDAEPGRLFVLDQATYDDLHDMFDGALDCLKIVLQKYLDERKRLQVPISSPSGADQQVASDAQQT